MVEAYLKMLNNYAVFTGRSRRRDYWLAYLMNVIIIVVLNVLAFIIPFIVYVSSLYSLAVLVPGIALSIRRLHDISKSGWWLFIGFVPIVGAIILLVFFATDSEGDNEYGPNPKAAETVTFDI